MLLSLRLTLTSLAGGDLWQVALSLLVSVEKDLRSSVITYNSAMRLGRKDVWMCAFEGLKAFCFESLFGGFSVQPVQHEVISRCGVPNGKEQVDLGCLRIRTSLVVDL